MAAGRKAIKVLPFIVFQFLFARPIWASSMNTKGGCEIELHSRRPTVWILTVGLSTGSTHGRLQIRIPLFWSYVYNHHRHASVAAAGTAEDHRRGYRARSCTLKKDLRLEASKIKCAHSKNGPNGHKTKWSQDCRSEDQTIKVNHNPAHKPVAENAGAGPSVIVPYMHVYKAIRKYLNHT